jgi:hypothetical protein
MRPLVLDIPASVIVRVHICGPLELCKKRPHGRLETGLETGMAEQQTCALGLQNVCWYKPDDASSIGPWKTRSGQWRRTGL